MNRYMKAVGVSMALVLALGGCAGTDTPDTGSGSTAPSVHTDTTTTTPGTGGGSTSTSPASTGTPTSEPEAPFMEDWKYQWVHVDLSALGNGRYEVRVNGLAQNMTSTVLDLDSLPAISVNGVTLEKSSPAQSVSSGSTQTRAKGELEFIYTGTLTAKPTTASVTCGTATADGSSSAQVIGDYTCTRGDMAEVAKAVADKLASNDLKSTSEPKGEARHVDGVPLDHAVTIGTPKITKGATGAVVEVQFTNNTDTTTSAWKERSGTSSENHYVEVVAVLLDSGGKRLYYTQAMPGDSGEFSSGVVLEAAGPVAGGETVTLTADVYGYLVDQYGNYIYASADGSVASVNDDGYLCSGAYTYYETPAKDESGNTTGDLIRFLVDGDGYVVNESGDYLSDLSKDAKVTNRYDVQQAKTRSSVDNYERMKRPGVDISGNETSWPVEADLTGASPVMVQSRLSRVETADVLVDFS